jgi:excisionase family DNA binding protein
MIDMEERIKLFEDNKLYRISEAAKILGITRQTLNYHIKKNRLNVVLMGGVSRRILGKDLNDFLVYLKRKD